MGNKDSCLFCLKNKDDIDIVKKIERKEPAMEIDSVNEIEPLEIEPIVKYPIENKPEEEEIPSPEPIILSKDQFNSNPFEKYKIISDDTPNSKIISLIDDPEITRLMIIIPNKENICDKEKNKSFMNKVENLQSLEHSHISKIYELYIYDYNYYLICEYIKEKNLLEKISSGTLDESVIKIIMEQIFNSIIYLHKENIFNIGLKLDEIILIETSIKPAKKKILKKKSDKKDNKDKDDKKGNEAKKKYDIKISTINYLKENYETDINSLVYYSPEIIDQIEENNLIKNNNNEDDNEDVNDEWVCGIIMYYLLSREFPFKGETEEEIYSNININDIDFSSPKFENISDSCKDLISKLLEKDENKRIKSKDCLSHSFFSEEKIIKKEELNEELLEILKNLLKVKKPASKFHEIIIECLCSFIDEEEKKKLSDLFKYIDEDTNNIISEQDIKNAFDKNKIIYTDEHINNILDVFDYEKNNVIKLEDFIRVLCDKDNLYSIENLQQIYNDIDIDKKNYINLEDIKNFVSNNEKLNIKEEEDFMESFGMKPDDKLIFMNFTKAIKENKLYPATLFKKFKKKK